MVFFDLSLTLHKFYIFSLLQHLQNIKPDVESHGVVSKVPLFMVTSFLYAIDLDCMNNTQEISGGNSTINKIYQFVLFVNLIKQIFRYKGAIFIFSIC